MTLYWICILSNTSEYNTNTANSGRKRKFIKMWKSDLHQISDILRTTLKPIHQILETLWFSLAFVENYKQNKASASCFCNLTKLSHCLGKITLTPCITKYSAMFTYYNILDTSCTEQVPAHFTFSSSIVIFIYTVRKLVEKCTE